MPALGVSDEHAVGSSMPVVCAAWTGGRRHFLGFLVIVLCVTKAWGLPSVPGYEVSTYTNVLDPVRLSFAPSGDLYVGRDSFYSGGGYLDAAKIHRVTPGGTLVLEYGDDVIPDPDAVLYDATGAVSGVPGSVLVAGQFEVASRGQIKAIYPDGTIGTVVAPTTLLVNPQQMAFDRAGRLLCADYDLRRIVIIGNDSVLPLTAAQEGGTSSIAIAADNRIFSTWQDGHIRVFAPNGRLLDGAFLINLGPRCPIVFGTGTSLWGNDLYALSNGELLRVTLDGQVTVLGTGFGTIADQDIAFGPDDGMYLSDPEGDRVLRIVPEPASLFLMIFGGLVLFCKKRWAAP